MVNAYTEPLSFTIFDGLQKPWSRVVDTSFASPEDILEPGSEVPVVGSKYLVEPRSIVVLAQ
jgi:isoamylase